MTLHEVIKQFRLASNMTQAQIADKMHMTEQTYARWEKGKTKMTDEKLQLFASALNVDVSEINTTPSRIFNLLTDSNNSVNANIMSDNSPERDVNGLVVHNHYYGDNELSVENQHLKAIILEKDKMIASKDEQIATLQALVATLQSLIQEKS